MIAADTSANGRLSTALIDGLQLAGLGRKSVATQDRVPKKQTTRRSFALSTPLVGESRTVRHAKVTFRIERSGLPGLKRGVYLLTRWCATNEDGEYVLVDREGRTVAQFRYVPMRDRQGGAPRDAEWVKVRRIAADRLRDLDPTDTAEISFLGDLPRDPVIAAQVDTLRAARSPEIRLHGELLSILNRPLENYLACDCATCVAMRADEFLCLACGYEGVPAVPPCGCPERKDHTHAERHLAGDGNCNTGHAQWRVCPVCDLASDTMISAVDPARESFKGDQGSAHAAGIIRDVRSALRTRGLPTQPVAVEVKRWADEGCEWRQAHALVGDDIEVELGETMNREPGQYYFGITTRQGSRAGDRSIGIHVSSEEIDGIINALIAVRARAVAEGFSA
jgi:hypothetical protein